MDQDLSNLTLIDLISEQHAELRSIVESRWKEISDIKLTHTEWHIIAKVDQKSLSISKLSRIVGISRQAMQKSVSKLEQRGIVQIIFEKNNHRDKIVKLTIKGEACCNRSNLLKETLEQQIEEKIGAETVHNLKEYLKVTLLNY